MSLTLIFGWPFPFKQVLVIYKHTDVKVGSNMTFCLFDLDQMTMKLKLDLDMVKKPLLKSSSKL